VTRWIAVSWLALGCAGQSAPVTAPTPAADPAPARTGQPSQEALERGIAQARADSARYPYTKADIAFMTGMIGHHAQAITMAQMAATHGARPEVVTLAGRVINAQRDEIALMENWLRDRRQPVPDAAHAGMGHGPGGMMPGMLTPEQMAQLDRARGPEFDELFLRLMIQHHNGAVRMVKDLFDSYGAAQDNLVFKFAADVNIDQTTEIARMEKLLFSIITQKNSK